MLTARGQVFVAPVKEGRIVEVTRKPGVRYREARFLPDGKSVFALSDETGEVEFWKFPANGVGKPEPLTSEGKVLRWEGEASPDGRWIAHHDKNQQLWLLDLKTRKQQRLATSTSPYGGFQDLSWSPDSRWLAWSVAGSNSFNRIYLYQRRDRQDRAADLRPLQQHEPGLEPGRQVDLLPLGPQPAHSRPLPLGSAPAGSLPHGDHRDLRRRSEEGHPLPLPAPRRAASGEGQGQDETDKDTRPTRRQGQGQGRRQGQGPGEEGAPAVEIDLDGLAARLYEVPVPPGNYEIADGGRGSSLLALRPARGRGRLWPRSRRCPSIPRRPIPRRCSPTSRSTSLSADGKKLMIRKEEDFYVLDAGDATGDDELSEKDLAKAKVDLSGWTFPFNPREQWQQMFREAWRLERDYFYDPKMHGVDWPAMLEKYRPL